MANDIEHIKCECGCGKNAKLWITYVGKRTMVKYWADGSKDIEYPNGIISQQTRTEKIFLCENEHETSRFS